MKHSRRRWKEIARETEGGGGTPCGHRCWYFSPTFPGSRGTSTDLCFRVQFFSRLLITWRDPGFKNEKWQLEYNSPIWRDRAPEAALLPLGSLLPWIQSHIHFLEGDTAPALKPHLKPWVSGCWLIPRDFMSLRAMFLYNLGNLKFLKLQVEPSLYQNREWVSAIVQTRRKGIRKQVLVPKGHCLDLGQSTSLL